MWHKNLEGLSSLKSALGVRLVLVGRHLMQLEIALAIVAGAYAFKNYLGRF
jgi:hypothetical protein